MDIWEILGKKRAIEVLLEIYQSPGKYQTQIADKSSEGSGAKRDRISELVDAGYLRTEKDPKNWSAIRYYVTDEGERICKHLIQIKFGDDPKPMNCGSPSEEGNPIKVDDEL